MKRVIHREQPMRCIIVPGDLTSCRIAIDLLGRDNVEAGYWPDPIECVVDLIDLQAFRELLQPLGYEVRPCT